MKIRDRLESGKWEHIADKGSGLFLQERYYAEKTDGGMFRLYRTFSFTLWGILKFIPRILLLNFRYALIDSVVRYKTKQGVPLEKMGAEYLLLFMLVNNWSHKGYIKDWVWVYDKEFDTKERALDYALFDDGARFSLVTDTEGL